MQITGGAGNNYGAEVDENNRLHTEAVSRNVLTEAVFNGEAFNFNTGAITLTSGSESAIAYFKYDGDDPFVIKEILIIVGDATGTLTSDMEVTILRNPTGGTIVSGATDIDVASNRDFSSSIVVSGDTYKGAEANTLTGGTTFATTTRGSSFTGVISFDAGEIILRKGNSLGINFTPPTGNTSQVVKVASTGYISGSDVFA